MILAAMMAVSLLAPMGNDGVKGEAGAAAEAAAEFYRAYFLETVEGRYDEALRVYQRLSQSPSVFGDDPRLRTWVLLRLTACHLRSGEHEAARVCLERAREAAAPLEEIRAGIEALTAALAGETGEEESHDPRWKLRKDNTVVEYLRHKDLASQLTGADRQRVLEAVRRAYPSVDPESIEILRAEGPLGWLLRFEANDTSFVYSGSLRDLEYSDSHPDPSVRLAISRGRSWMKYRQATEGNWSGIGQWSFGEGEEARSGEATMAVNALATMARGGDLRRAREFLIDSVLPEPSSEGWLVPGDVLQFPGYGLALTTLALCVTNREDESIDVLPALVENILDTRSPRLGWFEAVGSGHSDTHSTVLMMLALAVAERCADLTAYTERLEEAFDGAYSWLHAVRGSRSGIVGWQRPGEPGIPLRATIYTSYPTAGYRKDLRIFNAAALLLHQLHPPKKSVDLSADVALLLEPSQLPTWNPGSETEPSSIDFVYWWWGTAALNRYGGAAAERWNAHLFEALLAKQNSDGSWPAIGRWGPILGQTGTTALAVLALDAARPAVAKPETQKK